ncbi:uncharacterized protein LOC101855476 [Aplysia californica]|uniref:Uncharacterized protein LOC101855476 n=1 Tax=Aplysia californica TaxID=6500 RepID=A0ABM0JIK0_APLCA|nr:uncharacterized protein LOC101855476 [Aplysia californica]
MPEQSPSQVHISSISRTSLRNLCALLKSEGDKVLNGVSSFTLTTEVLTHLNIDCRRHSISGNGYPAGQGSLLTGNSSFLSVRRRPQQTQENKMRAEWDANIQFVKDFMLSTPRLKIIHTSSTLSSPISLHRFLNLSVLELRKVPIHMVGGMHGLRASLKTLIVYRCLDKVKDLLECCGGDMTAPMTWAQLQNVSLSFNAISCLDESLRLLPCLESLDISHNTIQSCEGFLEILGDVKSIALAFNSLTTIPKMSLCSRTSLAILILRGNNLDNISGLEVLAVLQELDLGENCLNDHSLLEPLLSLNRLKQLHLDGNPLSYHQHHRGLTVCHLARSAATLDFELDKKKLIASELSNVLSMRSRQQRRGQRSDQPASPVTPVARDNLPDLGDAGLSGSSAATSEAESRGTVTPRRNRRKKRLKPRYTEIQDMDQSEDFSSSRDGTPVSSPAARRQNLEDLMKARQDDVRKTMKEVEELRRHYGPNWLQAIEDKRLFGKTPQLPASSANSPSNNEVQGEKSKVSASSPSVANEAQNGEADKESGVEVIEAVSSSAGFPTEDDLYLNETVNPIMSAIARMAAGHSADETEESGSVVRFPEFTSSSGLSHLATTPPSGRSDLIVKPTSLTIVGPKHLPRSSSQDMTHSTPEKIQVQSRDFSAEDFPPTGDTDQLDAIISTGEDKDLLDRKSSSTVPVNSQERGGGSRPKVTSQLSMSLKEDDEAMSLRLALAKQVASLSPIKAANETETSPVKTSEMSMSKKTVVDRSMSELDYSAEDTMTLEEEEVTEAMFVCLPGNHIIIVTTTASLLVEKDISGNITQTLDLSALTSVREVKGSAEEPADGGKKNRLGRRSEKVAQQADDAQQVRLILEFDYMKKDKQRRDYSLEKMDAKILCERLQPVLDSREEQARTQSQVTMQCLKCNRRFLKHELVHKSQPLPTSGSSKDLRSMQHLMGKPTLMCPKCGSSIIIELEVSSVKPAASTTTRSTGSATSTPAGSYSSTSGYIEHSRKGSAGTVVAGVRRRSQDVYSPESSGIVTASAIGRKLSSGSLDLSSPSSRKGSQAGGSVRSAGGLPTGARDSRSSSTNSTRERSGAFSAALKPGRRSFIGGFSITNSDTVPSEREELVCVEDHFGEEAGESDLTLSTQLAAMTTSLRGVPSTRGPAAYVPRSSLSEGTRGGDCGGKKTMMDSGFESGIEVDAGRPSGMKHGSDMMRSWAGPSSVTSGSSCDGPITSFQTLSGHPASQMSKDNDSAAAMKERQPDNNSKERGRTASRVSAELKNLATMEDYVNNLVEEGRSLGQRRGSTDSKGRSISITQFLRSSAGVGASGVGGGQGPDSTKSGMDEGEGHLQRSVSGSSITVLPNPGTAAADVVDAGLTAPQTSSNSLSSQVTFQVGTPELEKSLETSLRHMKKESHAGTGVMTLNSDICSSMVSSVYESSVTTPENERVNADGVITDGVSEAVVPVTVISSSESGKSGSDDDDELTSIYDKPTTVATVPSSKRTGSRDTTAGRMDGLADDGAHADSVGVVAGEQEARSGQVKPRISDNTQMGAVSSSSYSEQQRTDSYGEPKAASSSGFHEDPADSLYSRTVLADYDSEERWGEDGGNNSSKVSLDTDGSPQFAFHHLNHRLTLYMMMSVFLSDEEFLCKLQGEMVQYIITDSFEGILIMSTERFYVMKITSEDHSKEPDQWLQCVEIQPIPELRYIDVGLGGQSLRLEFNTDCSSFTIVTRNRDKTSQFVDLLHTELARYAVSHGITSSVVVNEDVDQVTLDNLDADLISKVNPGQKMLCYCMGYIDRGHQKLFPVSFVVSSCDVCLVRTNHQWPQPRLQGPITVETVGKQFVLLERQKINNIASVEVCEVSMRKIRLELFNELEGSSSNWNITMATRQSVIDFINALSEPWSREFGVEMDILYTELNF